MEENMEDVPQDIAEEKMVQVFELYRTGWTEPKKAKFAERVVRTLWKRGPLTTGALSSILHLPVQDKLFQEALKALVAWKLIKLAPRPWGSALLAECTEEADKLVAETTQSGAFHAVNLIGERQKKHLPAEGE
jgi:hypothetical protein